MPKKHDPVIDGGDDVELDDDDEPIPARRDVRIFHRKKEDEDSHKEDFEEDVFV